MKKEIRTVYYDEELQVEAYRFQGIMQKFPNHFHEYYVLGVVESGRRFLTCKNQSYTINPGNLVLFNPGDNHACQQVGDDPLDWRCLNIKTEIMSALAAEMTGCALPYFTVTVVHEAESAARLAELHQMILEACTGLEKEEALYFLVAELIRDYTRPVPEQQPQINTKVQKTCDYIEAHYAEPVTLQELCEVSGLKKYTLLRYFTRQRGITPYQYLETVRVSAAKRLLEEGCAPVQVAVQAGFTDQSHFTHFFKNYIGLTPGQYQNIFRHG